MESVQIPSKAMDVAGHFIRVIFSLIGTAIRSFAGAMLILELGWGLLVAYLSFRIAADGSFVRGLLAVVAAMVFVTITACVLSAGFAAVVTIRKAIREAGFGRLMFDRLLDLVVARDHETRAPGQAESDQTILSVHELDARLTAAAAQLVDADTKPSLWLAPLDRAARWITRLAVMSTVRVVVRSCSADGKTVRLSDVRDRLASTIDDRLASYLQEVQVRQSLGIVFVISILAVLAAAGIRQLPF